MKLDKQARARRALASQGYAQVIAASLSDDQVAELTDCCSESGQVAADAPDRVRAVVAAFYSGNKATSDDTDTIETNEPTNA
ncbi:MAG: hypothetical protein AAGJ46_14440 [Planctomycetota bacterium]